MQSMTKLITCLVMLFAAASISAFAEDARKEALLDTGKGGFKLLMSVPSFGQGPYDFAKNDGVKIKTFPDMVYGEGMYNAPISDTAVVIYQAMVVRRINPKKDVVPVTAEHLASEMLKGHGFKLDRATKIDCPKAPVEGGSIACYKASGYPIFDGQEKKMSKDAMVVVGVSFANNTQGYALMVTVAEKNIAAFDKEPEKYEKRANNGLGDLYRNAKFDIN